jgi:hypothetical protein
MKRSEAIEKLYEKLWIYGVPELQKKDAAQFLKFIEEELKMLPPNHHCKLTGDFKNSWESD